MLTVQIEDEFQVYEFEAEILGGPVSTRQDARGRNRARWLELAMYRKEDGSFVFCQANQSVVWHVPSGRRHVRRPAEVAAAQLPEDAVYCGVFPAREGRGQCPVLSSARPVTVLAELPQHKVWACPDWDSAVRAMTVFRREDGSATAAVSDPMRELMEQIYRNDPTLRRTKTVVRM